MVQIYVWSKFIQGCKRDNFLEEKNLQVIDKISVKDIGSDAHILLTIL